MATTELPLDHTLARVYRAGAGLTGLVLLGFGIAGFFSKLSFFSTHGKDVLGLSSNGLLSLISVLVGLILLGAAVIGGNLASTVNMIFGGIFLVAGLVNLGLMQTSANFLAFRMPNVIFSFVVGLVLLTFGLYGRVSGGLTEPGPVGAGSGWHEKAGTSA